MPTNERLDQFREEIFELVSENEVPQAIDKVLALYPNSVGTYYDDLLLLCRQFQDLEDRQLSGRIDDEDATIEKNKITYGLINIVTNLDKDPVAAKHFGLTVEEVIEQREAKSEETSRPTKVNTLLLGIISVILIGLVIVFLIPSKETPITDKEEQEQESNNPEIERPQPITFSMSEHSSKEKGKNLEFNQPIEEGLLSKRDKHYYYFTVKEDTNHRLILTNLSSEFNPVISMYNDRGNRLFGISAKGAGQGIDHIFTGINGRRYLMEITSRASASFGEYALLITYPEN